jgi:transposase
MSLACRAASSSPRQTNDCTQAIPLADKGYDTDPILNHLNEHGMVSVIQPRSLRKVQRSFDHSLYRQRNRIQRTFAHLRQFRRLTTRFDKLKRNFHVTVAIVYTSRWLRQ